MENFDGEDIDDLLEIRQYFPCQNFAPYGNQAFIYEMTQRGQNKV